MSKIKVAIVDDHTILRQVLARSLGVEYDIDIVGSWNCAEDAIEFIKSDTVDVIIMDYKLPGMTGPQAGKILMEMMPELKIIMLSAFSGDDEVFTAIQAGAVGYLPKEVTVETLVEAIRSVYRGNAFLDPFITRKVLNKFSGMRRKLSEDDPLTDTEKQLLTYAGQGYSNRKIAEKIKLNENSIKTLFHNILKKLNAKDRTNAVVIAMREGWIEQM